MKYFFAVTTALLVNINIIGQVGFEFDSATPQTADMIRYGNLPIKKYTGEVGVSIPLSGIKTRNFSLPISVSHSNPGFIPNKQDGPLGYCWFLNAGGVIHRKVIGVPDESRNNTNSGIHGATPGANVNFHGFVYGISNSVKPSVDQVEGHRVGVVNKETSFLSGTGGDYETMPDEFTFNFGNYSGTFLMSYDGEVKVMSESPVNFKVDLSGMSSYSNGPTVSQAKKLRDVENSKIKITTDDGYQYIFGGEISSLEFSINVGSVTKSNIHGESVSESYNVAANPTIGSWHLTKIIAPDGEEMIFSYKKGITSVVSLENFFNTNASGNKLPTVFNVSYGQNVNPWLVNSIFNYSSPSVYYLNPNASAGVNYNNNQTIYSSKTVAYLESITVKDKINVSLSYKLKSKKFYGNLTGKIEIRETNNETYQLEGISFYDITQTPSKRINSFSFDYTYGNENSRRLFLKAINEFGNSGNKSKSHVFDYTSYIFPNPTTLGVDFWGFYNGKDNNTPTDFIPEEEYDEKNYQKVIGFKDSKREASSDSNNCMLKRITYPTKGYTEFEYENHTYSRRVEFNPKLGVLGVDGIIETGGVRVKSITDFDGKEKKTRYFSYHNESNNTSNGILTQWPRFKTPTINNNGLNIYNSSYNFKVAFGSHMEYGEVKEIFPNNSYTISHFTNYSNKRDTPITTLSTSLSAFNSYSHFQEKEGIYFGLNGVEDRSMERGKLRTEEQYNSIGRLKRKVRNFYYYDGVDTNEVYKVARSEGNLSDLESIGFNFLYYHPQIGVNVYRLTRFITKRYYSSNFLTRTRETTYETKDDYKTIITDYKYSPKYNKLLKERVENTEEKIWYVTENKYPFSGNISDQAKSIYGGESDFNGLKDFVITKNLLPILETSSSIQEYNTSTIDNKTREYPIIKQTKINNTLNKFNFSNSFYTLNSSFSSKADNPYIKENTFKNYVGNKPYESVSKSGVTTTYLWGYKGEYPIAKIDNASLQQVARALGVTEAALKNYNEDQLSQIDNLRSVASLNKAMITTYHFKPFVGLSSVTDPRGYTTTYTYDSFNRLFQVKDANGKVLSKNEYEYK